VSRRRRFGGELSDPTGRASRGMTAEQRVRVPDDAPVTRSPTALPDTQAHIATLKTDIERLTAELAGERAALAGEREARQADQEQLAAARAAADRATASLSSLRGG
jgi:hypothetical protein